MATQELIKLQALSLLEELVNTSSQTKDKQGVNRVQHLIHDCLTYLDFQCHLLSPLDHHQGGDLLVAKRKGRGKKIVLVCHADTVIPVSERCFFRESGDKIFGPGIADNKAGIVVIITALRLLAQQGMLDHFDWQIVSSPNEEIGSPGWHTVFRDIGQQSDYIFGFEPALSNGNIIHGRNGNRWYDLTIQGSSAHSGRLDAPHLNAAHELSHIISSLSLINSWHPCVRFHVSEITAGQNAYNIVCGQARAKIDTRFPNFEWREKMHQYIEKVFFEQKESCPHTGRKAQISYEIADDCPPMASRDDVSWADFYLDQIQTLEQRKIFCEKSGGAADCNYFSHPHNFVLDGLGAIGAHLHTQNEYIETKSLWSRSRAFSQFLLSLCQTSTWRIQDETRFLSSQL